MKNICKDCGYTWKPRGRLLSRKCPACSSHAVDYEYSFFIKLVTLPFALLYRFVLMIWAWTFRPRYHNSPKTSLLDHWTGYKNTAGNLGPIVAGITATVITLAVVIAGVMFFTAKSKAPTSPKPQTTKIELPRKEPKAVPKEVAKDTDKSPLPDSRNDVKEKAISRITTIKNLKGQEIYAEILSVSLMDFKMKSKQGNIYDVPFTEIDTDSKKRVVTIGEQAGILQ